MERVTVTNRGARRWTAGHPWIYRSDVVQEPEPGRAGVVSVWDGEEESFLGRALYSPSSEIRIRMLTPEPEAIDVEWWAERIRRALALRERIPATAYRAVHAEADGLPSLIVDRYGRWAAVQLLSAGLEACRADVLEAIIEIAGPDGILLRNDMPVRRYEELPQEVELVHGEVPEEVDVEEHGVRYRVRPWEGQKTGAFLDQRENRVLAGSVAYGRALDVFTYEGAFALHLGRRADAVLAVDQDRTALERGEVNADLNGLSSIEWVEANAFDLLNDLDDAGARFDVVVLDPPAFAKSKRAVDRALRGYKEINLRAMRILEPGGRLLSFSCSYHVDRDRFLTMLADAAADSGRTLTLERTLGQPVDHPEILTIPETGYLKGAVVRALD